MKPLSVLRPAVVPALTCLALLAVLGLRRPEMFLTPQLWAEDGTVFFLQADSYGSGALFMPYGGYHHLLLRLIAALAAPLSAVVAPAAYFWACMAVTVAVAAAMFSPRIDLRYRPACALALGLIPHTGEVMGNLTNLQWIAALGLVWLLLAAEAPRAWQQAGDALVAGVLGLTGVFAVLFAPLFLLRAWQRRTPAAWVLAAVVVAAATVQAVTISRTGDPGGPTLTPWSLPLFLKFIGLRLPASLCLPGNLAMQLPAGVVAGLGVVVVALLLAAAGWPGRQRTTRGLLVACLGLVLAGSFYRFRHNPLDLGGIVNGDRYFFLPKLLAAWLLIQGLALPGWRRWAGAGLCAAALTASAVDWRYERLTDYHWAGYARRIDAGEYVPGIPLNPGGWLFSHPGRRGSHRPH